MQVTPPQFSGTTEPTVPCLLHLLHLPHLLQLPQRQRVRLSFYDVNYVELSTDSLAARSTEATVPNTPAASWPVANPAKRDAAAMTPYAPYPYQQQVGYSHNMPSSNSQQMYAAPQPKKQKTSELGPAPAAPQGSAPQTAGAPSRGMVSEAPKQPAGRVEFPPSLRAWVDRCFERYNGSFFSVISC